MTKFIITLFTAAMLLFSCAESSKPVVEEPMDFPFSSIYTMDSIPTTDADPGDKVLRAIEDCLYRMEFDEAIDSLCADSVLIVFTPSKFGKVPKSSALSVLNDVITICGPMEGTDISVSEKDKVGLILYLIEYESFNMTVGLSTIQIGLLVENGKIVAMR